MAAVDEHSAYFLHLAGPLELVPGPQGVGHAPASDSEDHDIYRGEPPSPPRSPSPSSITSSSSSASSVLGGRLGAISAVVEHAIARWARAWASSSSLDTASTTSDVSIATMTKSQMARRRKRLSLADVHNARSEREIAARIRAREESRYIPRTFDLYVPYAVDVGVAGSAAQTTTTVGADRQQRHVLHTASLPVLIAHLGATLKEHGKTRRGRSEMPSTEPARSSPPILHHDYMMPDEPPEPPPQDANMRRRARKGKHRAGVPAAFAAFSSAVHSTPDVGNDPERLKKAWWLDVSSPTWEDMRAIGKLLHLHPLTLEDILQQDPREKLENFPKLGYHFIVFRAIESQKTRVRFRTETRQGGSDKVIDESDVGEVNVYLVVFREGICSFHFADVSEHVDRIRSRIMKFAENVNMSSDWIAHGVMDSIIDSVFPVLNHIEKEVDEIESLVVTDQDCMGIAISPAEDLQSSSGSETIALHELSHGNGRSTSSLAKKAMAVPRAAGRKLRWSLPTRVSLFFNSLRAYSKELYSLRALFKVSPTHVTKSRVQRMARTRRLVTSLARFLAHKSEVVAQIQKRLLATGEWGIGSGADNDMFVYMGDVQDHILTLQQSLAHYERVLSQSHPTYLAHLRLSVSRAQAATDNAFATVSIISLGVLCVQTVIGLNSMNVPIPANDFQGDRFYVFGIVLSASFLVLVVYGVFVRHLWKRSKRRPTRF